MTLSLIALADCTTCKCLLLAEFELPLSVKSSAMVLITTQGAIIIVPFVSLQQKLCLFATKTVLLRLSSYFTYFLRCLAYTNFSILSLNVTQSSMLPTPREVCADAWYKAQLLFLRSKVLVVVSWCPLPSRFIQSHN